MKNMSDFIPKKYKHLEPSNQEIARLAFYPLSSKEIREGGIEIKSEQLAIPKSGRNAEEVKRDITLNRANGLYSPLLGAIDRTSICETCNSNYYKCPGHTGYIELGFSIYNPIFVQTLKKILNLFCWKCFNHSLTMLPDKEGKYKPLTPLFNPEEVKKRFENLNYDQRLDAVISCVKRACRNTEKDSSGREIFHSVYDWKISRAMDQENTTGITEFKIKAENGSFSDNVDIDTVKTFLQNISDDHMKVLGFNVRPENFIMEAIPVVSHKIRPYNILEGDEKHDSLTNFYKRILNLVNSKSKTYKTDVEKLYTSFVTDKEFVCDSSSVSEQIKTFRAIFDSKDGVIRYGTFGKRTNFTGRTVVVPDPSVDLTEVSLPEEFRNITVEESVTDDNIEEITLLWIEREIKAYTRNEIFRDLILAEEYIPKIGDIVHRKLKDGDLIIVNRQPSLHKYSLLGVVARFRKGQKTIGINPSLTTPLNADFDGDELNISVPQSLAARHEVMTRMFVEENIMSISKEGSVFGLIQDSLIGSYHLTNDITVFTKQEWIQIYTQRRHGSLFPSKSFKQRVKEVLVPEYRTIIYDRKLDVLNKKKEKIKNELDENKDENKQLLRDIENEISKLERNRDLEDSSFYDKTLVFSNLRYTPEEAALYSGKSLFSSLFPPDFNYKKNTTDGDVVIKNGILKTGRLTKTVLGTSSSGIITSLYRRYGGKVVSEFISDTQRIVGEYLKGRGFTIGIKDLTIDETTDNKIKEAIGKELNSIIELENQKYTKSAFTARKEKIEADLLEKLNGIRDITSLLLEDQLKNNRIMDMIKSGAKGDPANISQMLASVGQQTKEQARLGDSEKRPTSSFVPGTKDPVARGFCRNSFYDGLTPEEYFFHAMSSRLSLIDTAINTSSTGYASRKLRKAMEDEVVFNDGTVRNVGTGKIIQFNYGDDGFSPAKLTNTYDGLRFFDMSEIDLPSKRERGFVERERLLIDFMPRIFRNKKPDKELYEIYRNRLYIDTRREVNVYENYEDIPQSINFVKQGILTPTCHLGQRKLLLSEIQFLSNTKNKYVVYAGSAPGNHIYYLSNLFPDKKFILIDPNPFALIRDENDKFPYHRNTPDKNIIHLYTTTGKRSFYKGNTYNFSLKRVTQKVYNDPFEKARDLEIIEVIKNEPFRIFIIERSFVNNTAKMLERLEDIVFISDIRTSMGRKEGITDLDIVRNSAMQYNWLKIMKPDYSLVKFRTPFFNPEDTTHFNKNYRKYSDMFEISLKNGINFIENYKDGKFEFVPGIIKLQAWAPKTSAETRLSIGKDQIDLKRIYDVEKYTSALFYHNLISRGLVYHTNENSDENLAFDHCNDCALENKILNNYIKTKKVSVTKSDVVSIVREISKLFKDLHCDSHGTLFTKLTPNMLNNMLNKDNR